MATLADLRSRIISETARDDLADTMAPDLDAIIAKSIDQYAAERWWFNETRATSVCVVGAEYQPVPPGGRWIDSVWLTIGGVRYSLAVRSDEEIEGLYSVPMTGQPTDYCWSGDDIRVWPTPNVAYPIIWNLIADVTPALDYGVPGSANAWTNAGQDLITSQAKIRLYRDYLSATAQDPRLANAVIQESEAYSRLRAESTRKTTTGRVRAAW